jgi:lipoprotein NlpI
MTEWPAPLVQMFLGQTTPTSVAAAAEILGRKRPILTCEANFFSGEFALREGDKNEAERLFRLSINCPVDFAERYAAIAELKALGANR